MYERKRTWVEFGPPWAKAAARAKGMGDTVSVAFPFLGSGSGSAAAANPYGFLEDGTPYNFTTSGGQMPANAPASSPASSTPCFTLAFPWVGSQVAGVCQSPIAAISPTMGMIITAAVVGLFVFRMVGR